MNVDSLHQSINESFVMVDAPLWITEADVDSLLTMPEAIAALERGLVSEAQGDAQNMLKTHIAWGDGNTLHALGAVMPASGLAGTKTWTHTAGGARPLLILFDSHTGAVRAIIEAFTLGQLRTGGMSGVATRWLARADATELALIGSGKQAAAQVAGVAAVRPLQQVRVFSPNAQHRAACVEHLRPTATFEVTEHQSVAAAVDGAAVITLVTRARQPILDATMPAVGTHVNAVGAITPDRSEFGPDLLARCTVVTADSVPTARTLARELIAHYDRVPDAWRSVLSLSRVVAEQRRRPAGADLTLFKAMGMGIADLALGIEVHTKAQREGMGRRLEVSA